MKIALTAGLLCVALILASPRANSDERSTALLLRAKALSCTFSKGTVGDWSSGIVKIKPADFGESGTITFVDINLKAGTATGVGNQGTSEDWVIASREGVTFIEETTSGNFSFITVFSAQGPPGSFLAVISRHMNLSPAGVLPSQYHGTCRILPAN